ncbi:HD domain-containing protein [Zavarzinella formosa]|uniref:HD domain-containing protein n=1 Tax=Zavarzinella formosa TaxID=360055 RepID=UPI0006976E03|nr:HD domain-containing protein [Zavarzinella formosa]
MASDSPVGRESILEAMSFAARAHRHQLRKDQVTPYVAHPFRVCFLVGTVFAVSDPVTLTAAVLHDTIEDTTTDHDDLSDKFGTEVADIVAALSKDTRQPHDAREEAYFKGIMAADDRVKIIKLADTLDNLIDSKHLPAGGQAKTVAKANHLLELLETDASASLRRCCEIVRSQMLSMANVGG